MIQWLAAVGFVCWILGMVLQFVLYGDITAPYGFWYPGATILAVRSFIFWI